MNTQILAATIRRENPNQYNFMMRCDKAVREVADVKTHGLTYKAVAREIYEQHIKHEQREEQRHIKSVSLETRLERRLEEITTKEIKERGLTTPPGWWNFEHGDWQKPRSMGRVVDYVPQQRMWLVRAEYYYEYSKQYTSDYGAYHAQGAYLTGYEDGQYWCCRVPGKIKTVAQALEWLTPNDVKKAVAAGTKVYRQGDLWVVEAKRKTNGLKTLTYSHRYDPDTHSITHREHKEIVLDEGKYYKVYFNKMFAHNAND